MSSNDARFSTSLILLVGVIGFVAIVGMLLFTGEFEMPLEARDALGAAVSGSAQGSAYASPEDFFTQEQVFELDWTITRKGKYMFATTLEVIEAPRASFEITIPDSTQNRFVYHDAYISYDGDAWVSFSLEPESQQGSWSSEWIHGAASGSQEMTLDGDVPHTVYVVAYTCTLHSRDDIDSYDLVQSQKDSLIQEYFSQEDSHAYICGFSRFEGSEPIDSQWHLLQHNPSMESPLVIPSHLDFSSEPVAPGDEVIGNWYFYGFTEDTACELSTNPSIAAENIHLSDDYHSGTITVPQDYGQEELEVVLSCENEYYIAENNAVITVEDSDGSGTEEDPYQISTCEGLQAINEDLDAHYVLENDIDCSSMEGFEPIGTYIDYENQDNQAFTGSLKGENNEIHDLSIEVDGEAGLFAYAEDALFENLFVEGSISGNDNAAILLVRGSNVEIINVHTYGTVEQDGGLGTAGLVAYLSGSDVIRSSSSASVSGSGAAGLVGSVGFPQSTIRESYSTGPVTGTGGFVGGLVSSATSTVIEDSYSLSSVEGEQPFGDQPTGGFIGQVNSDVIIKNAYAAGPVSAIITEDTGGLAGGTVEWSANAVESSYWDIQTTGQDTSPIGEGRTTNQMTQASNYQDWDFGSVWTIDSSNDGYPYLQNNPPE